MMSETKSPEIKLLDHCLTLIQTDKASLDDCLAQYPDHKEFLEPLLRMAVQARTIMAPTPPNAAFTKNAKIRILNQLQIPDNEPIIQQVKDRKFAFLGLRPAYALLSLVLVLGLLLSGIGATNASASALPGDVLYGLKRGIEETRLTFTFSAQGDAELLLQFSEERLQEALDVAIANPNADVSVALEGYANMMDRLIGLAENGKFSGDPETLDKIYAGLENHSETLQQVYEKVPEQAKQGIENAMERSSNGKSVIEQLKQGGKPSDQAPGQDKKDENAPEERGGGRPDDKTPKGKPKDKTPGPPDQTPGNPND